MSETKTLHRNFWVWEFEKEERWLNEMAQEGGFPYLPPEQNWTDGEAALSGKPSHRRYQHLQRCIAGMAEPALRHVFGLRAGTYQQQTRESGGRTSAPRVIFSP